MPTPTRQSHTAPSVTSRKQLKAEERARVLAAARARRLRRFALFAVPVALIVVAIVVYVIVQALQSGPPGDVRRFNATTAGGPGLAWSPDGTRLALTGEDMTIWDAPTGQLIRRLYGTRRPTNDVAWSPDGALLAVVAAPEALRKGQSQSRVEVRRTSDWAAAPGTSHLASLTGSTPLRAAFSPDGKRLAVQNGTDLVLLSVPGWKRLATVHSSPGEGVTYPILAWSADGRLLAAGIGTIIGEGSTSLGLFDGHTLRKRRTTALPGAFPSNTLSAVAWGQDATRLAVAGKSGSVAIYNARTGTEVRRLDHALNSIDSLAWSPDGRRLATGGTNGMAIWDGVTGHVLQQRDAPVDLPGSKALVNSVVGVSWSPDSTELAISGNNAAPRIWTPARLAG